MFMAALLFEAGNHVPGATFLQGKLLLGSFPGLIEQRGILDPEKHRHFRPTDFGNRFMRYFDFAVGPIDL